MTTLEKIRAEIRKVLDRERDFTSENAKAQALALMWVLEIIDKYAEQEQTGHWKNKEFRKEEYVLIGKCSVCGRGRVIDGFCSYCGCRMVDPKESEEA